MHFTDPRSDTILFASRKKMSLGKIISDHLLLHVLLAHKWHLGGMENLLMSRAASKLALKIHPLEGVARLKLWKLNCWGLSSVYSVNLFFISLIVLWNLKIGWFLRGKVIKN